MKLLLLSLLLFFCFPVFSAVEIVSVNSIQTFASVRITFTEPIYEWDDVTGAPTTILLTDLSHHFIYWRINVGGWNQLQVPASSVNGGAIQINQIDNIGVGPQEENTFESYYESVDDNSNVSNQSMVESLSIILDKTRPAPPIP